MADIEWRRSCEAWLNKFNFPWHWMHTLITSVVVHNTEMFQTNSDFHDTVIGHKYDYIPKVTFIITGKEIYLTETNFFSRFFTPIQTGPEAHPAFCTMGTGSFPREKSGRVVTLTPHPLLVSWSWKSRTIPLLPLCAVRPVQSLSACTRVHFFTFSLKKSN